MKIANRSESYRIDEINMTLDLNQGDLELDADSLTDYETALIKVLNARGFAVRNPTKDDTIRKAMGYDVRDAKMIQINNHWYTLQMRAETFEDDSGAKHQILHSGFLALSGSDLDQIELKNLLQKVDGFSKLTRVDVALDMTYKKSIDAKKDQRKLSRLVGFTPDYDDGNTQNPDNSITAGKRNARHPVQTASKTASNGLTLYIGSRSGKFMIRYYDKRAEVERRTGNHIAPTMRTELELKQENAEAVRKYLLASKGSFHTVVKKVFHGVMNDFITFDKRTYADVFDTGRAKPIQLDYTKIEGDEMTTDEWIQKLVAPKFNRVYNEKTPDEKIEKLIQLFGLKNELNH